MKQQETLEEFINSQPYYGSCTTEYLEGIEEGAKWQQERSYSEEDMRECWMACLGFNKPDKFNSRVKFEQWFEQLKNK